jgi:hypothetical protein
MLRPLQNSTNAVIPVETGIQKRLNLQDVACANKDTARVPLRVFAGMTENGDQGTFAEVSCYIKEDKNFPDRR